MGGCTPLGYPLLFCSLPEDLFLLRYGKTHSLGTSAHELCSCHTTPRLTCAWIRYTKPGILVRPMGTRRTSFIKHHHSSNIHHNNHASSSSSFLSPCNINIICHASSYICIITSSRSSTITIIIIITITTYLSIRPNICFLISWALLNDLAWTKFSKHQAFENLLFFQELYTANKVRWSPSGWWNLAFFWSAIACLSWISKLKVSTPQKGLIFEPTFAEQVPVPWKI